MFQRSSLIAIALLGMFVGALAQTDMPTEPLLINKPLPPAPKSTMGITGDVSIVVQVDKKGKVTSADYRDGPGWTCPSVADQGIIDFRKAAREAALKATFHPARTNGEPYAGRSILKYPFAVDGAPKERWPVMSTGALKRNAISLPQPFFPRAAIGKASGTVMVHVLVYEDGTVVAAEPINGNPLLHSAAHVAACRAKFSPILVDGNPVKVSGRFEYDFVP